MSISIAKVNRMGFEEFIQTFGNVVEHCAICVAAVWCHIPFIDVNEIHHRIAEFIDQLPSSGKLAILRLHPDLAAFGQLTTESSNEQKTAGLFDLSLAEKEILSRLNTNYKSKFGFPFVICARQNSKKAIIDGLRSRLHNTKEQEIFIGIKEVKTICMLRLSDIVDPDWSMM